MADDALDKAGKFTLGLSAEFVPFLGLAVETIKGFIPDNDQAMKNALLSELHADVNDLQQRVAKLEAALKAENKSPDTVQPTQAVVLWRAYFEGRTKGYSSRQREALKNAFVAQLDPRRGDEGQRKFWFDLVASMSDEELLAVESYRGRDTIILDEQTGKVLMAGGEPLGAVLAHPVAQGILKLQSRGLVSKEPHSNTRNALPGLKVVLSYIDPPNP